jgi:GAF domain-containing protein
LERTAALLARHAVRLVPGTQCAISVVKPDRPEWFSLLAGSGEWAEALIGGEWPLEGTLNGRAMLEGVPIETTSAQHESATAYVFKPGGIDTGRVVPLRVRTPLHDGRLAMGAIGFWREGSEPFNDDERALIDMYGDLASVLLHRAELLGTAVRATQRLESAVDVAVATGQSLVPTAVMRRLLERCLDAAHSDRASLCRMQGSSLIVLDVVDRNGPVDSVASRRSPGDRRAPSSRGVPLRVRGSAGQQRRGRA